MKNKTDRLHAIVQVIESQEICTQEELLLALCSRGFELTQATLSRDLKRLQIAKTPTTAGGYCYAMSAPLAQNRIPSLTKESIHSGAISLQFSHTTGVIRTRPGYASSVAYDIDTYAPAEILGTIAGDDTIMLIIDERVTREQTYQALLRFLPQLAWIKE